MAYRYRRSRYGRRRWYGRRKSGNRFTRKLRRSLNQKDTCRIILSSKPLVYTKTYVPKTQGALLEYNGAYTKLMTFNPMFTLMGCSNGQSVLENPLPGFSRFRDLFDQFKVNAVRLRIQIISQPLPNVNAAGLLRTAIDRNGLAPALNTAIQQQDDSTEHADSDTIAACNKMFESYSSFQQKIINSSDLYSIYRTFYPVGREKGQWYGASHMFTVSALSDRDLSDFQYPFKPIMFLQFYLSSLTNNGGKDVTFNIVYEYDITFKGQRNITE